MNKSVFFLIPLLLLGAAAMYRFFPPNAALPGQAPADPELIAEPIRIANIGIFSVFNPVAKEQGFFSQNGLVAKIDEYDSGATSIAALLAGEADVAMAADFVGVRNMFENKQLRAVAEVSSHDVFRVIARRSGCPLAA